MAYRRLGKVYRGEEYRPCGSELAVRYPVSGVEVSTFAYATEDVEKVERALRNVLPEGVNARFKQMNLKGHYNDPITVIQLKVRRKREASEILTHIMKGLSSLDLYPITEEIESRVDHAGNLYIRLDKQRAFTGVGMLNRVDPIRIKIKFNIPHKEEPAAYIKSVLEKLEAEQ